MNKEQRKKNYGLYAIALAIGIVGALALGLPVQTLILLGVVLACPLMMFFMMRGVHGGQQHDASHHDADQDDRLHRGDQPPGSRRQ
ncbi:DUF2933 domain-containing protein [Streptomyces sp. Rer75]|uniref:DUF2933 domain-containing protein n=1 Tax=Streptomyces sp. Rer75 TaxID=2750011 RepID=UPI0015CFC150|nr:DUF2933 domain-containing protein [Streptomyces sp. Rer75]QLH25298.1 DUF2933 domain-containing protein [Streptomyces sp. Rer75]